MFDPRAYRELCEELTASRDRMQEVIQMTQQKSSKKRRTLRVSLVAAAMCALTAITASAAHPELLEAVVASIRASMVVSGHQQEWLRVDGPQPAAPDSPEASVEERGGRVILTVDGAETDITEALAQDGQYVWRDGEKGSQTQVLVVLDENGTPMTVIHVAAAGERIDGAAVSVVDGPARKNK